MFYKLEWLKKGDYKVEQRSRQILSEILIKVLWTY